MKRLNAQLHTGHLLQIKFMQVCDGLDDAVVGDIATRDCSEKGLQVQSTDSSHVALVSLLLRESVFSDFKCERPTPLGMSVDSLAKTLKMSGPNDSLKLRWRAGADIVSFQCECEQRQR